MKQGGIALSLVGRRLGAGMCLAGMCLAVDLCKPHM